ncbi:Bcr/CflA family efflux MFS transporter [Stenotrophomonas sp. MMGLT7]|uniref:Bcr/CflA family efflux MFS transporter n=1 Tax=Stenotrophomonas sp. MMGLT7 TaxID=2901227 RepID=UPI001E2AC897|nr:Bcr/CflA family efflux MFS transporter [Stenotrophomonas sp. MMGLT7]
MSGAGAAPAAGRRRLVLLLGALSAFAPFATDMYLAGFPAIAADFGTDVGRVQLSLSSFFLGLCLGQLLYGPLTDAFGRRAPLLAGIALYTAASLALMLAPGIDAFVALRLLQAIGGCAGMIVARAVIQDVMAPDEAARALSAMMMVQGIGPVLAPVLGGYLLLAGGWRVIFAFLAAFGAACLLATWRGLQETLPRTRRRPLRLAAIVTTFAALLRLPAFVVPAMAAAMALAALFAYIAGSPFVFMELHGVSQQHYGWLSALNAGGMLLFARINLWLLRRMSPARALRIALAVLLLAVSALFLARGQAGLGWLLAPLFVAVGWVPVVAANATALAMAAGREWAGSASSLLGALQFGLATLASAGVGALHDGSATPMAAMMLVCAALAAVLGWVGRVRVSGG